MTILKPLFILACAASLALAGLAHAEFFDRGCGMIYDDVLDITWLQDFNHAMTSGLDADGLMTWDEANAWAGSLNVCGNEGWRLPTGGARPATPTSANELGSIWLHFDGGGGDPYGMTGDISPFWDLPENQGDSLWWWSGSAHPSDPSRHYRVDLGCACWDTQPDSEEYHATAVRDGDVAPVPDQDGDGVPDPSDNCIEVGNPGQCDTDGDDYGNQCDCDFDQNLMCNIADFTIFRGDYIASVDGGAGTDMDCNGAVSIADFSLFRYGYVAGQPGPSGVAPCIAEGDSRPVVPGAPPCCLGLAPIPCDAPGSSGCEFCVGAAICAACGNGICGLGENICNCPADCSP